MKRFRDRLLLSPSDLNAFLECEHMTALEMQRVSGALKVADSENAEAELRRTLGLDHEAAWRERFIGEGKHLVDVPGVTDTESGWHASAEATVDAMRAGADVIYQGVVLDDGWRGIADFMVRVEEPSNLGSSAVTRSRRMRFNWRSIPNRSGACRGDSHPGCGSSSAIVRLSD
jgi:hypothetical protein